MGVTRRRETVRKSTLPRLSYVGAPETEMSDSVARDEPGDST